MECQAERPGHLHYKITADFSVQSEWRATDGAGSCSCWKAYSLSWWKQCASLHYGACFNFLNSSVSRRSARCLSVWDHAITFSTELETVTFVNVGQRLDGGWEHEGDMRVRKVRRVNQRMKFTCATKPVGVTCHLDTFRNVLKCISGTFWPFKAT